MQGFFIRPVYRNSYDIAVAFNRSDHSSFAYSTSASFQALAFVLVPIYAPM